MSIVVDFAILPDDGNQGDRTPEQVCQELQLQLADPSSHLRSGEFGRFASNATLSGPGIAPLDSAAAGSLDAPTVQFGGAELDPRPPASASDVRKSFAHPATTSELHPSRPVPLSESNARAAPGDVARNGMSNADLVDRISQLEKQLQRTAAGGRQDQPPSTASRLNIPDSDLEEKCHQLQRRLENVERELRESEETAQLQRQRCEACEFKLKDRETLLVHAKDMWMKENIRASKLADALTAAEDRIADHEKRLADGVERYTEAQAELRSLQHLVNGGVHGSAARLSPRVADRLSPRVADRPPSSRFFTTNDLSMPATKASQHDDHDLALSSPPPLDAETNADRFRRLCQVNDAVLYEDELLQVGVKAEYSGKEGQLAVFFGNKVGAGLHAFTVQYFVKEEGALRLSASPVNQQLDAERQIIQRVTATILQPFVEAPIMRIQFLMPDTSPRKIQLRLPVVLTKFMVGRETTPQEFFQTWRQQHFVLNEVTSTVQLATRFRGALLNLARSIVFGGSLRMHHGVDTNPDNFVLVGQLPGSSSLGVSEIEFDRSRDIFGLGGDRENALSLVRVEVGNGRFVGKARVVVRSSDHAAARALCDGLVEILSEPGAALQSDFSISLSR